MPFRKDRNSRDDRPRRTNDGEQRFPSRSSNRSSERNSNDKKNGKRDDAYKPRSSSDNDHRNSRSDRDERPRRTNDGEQRFPSRSFDRNFGDKKYGKRDDAYKPRSSADNDRSDRNTRDDRSKRTNDGEQRFPSRSSDRNFGDKKYGKRDDAYKPRSTPENDRGNRNSRTPNDRTDRRPSFGDSDRRFEKKKDFNGRDFDRRDREHNEQDGEKTYFQKRKFAPARNPASANPKDDGLIRLNRYIANSGICSRRKADELITAGVITVNGEVVTELGSKVDPAKDEIRYNNERLKREKMVYVLLNKPKDYITTTDDPQERRTVMQLVSKATKERIYPVGRLDRNTTGLLLLTNDGNLAEKLAHPRNNVSKIYNVELDKNLTQGDFNKLEFGLELEDGFVKPDDLSYVVGGSKREIGIKIHSGKNRIVRRMFEHLGYDVIKLDRVVYANLTKKDLPRGRWRYLEERELIQLKHFIK